MTHDFTKRSWGHDYSITKVIDGGKQIRAVGWGGDGGLPEEGDFLILPNEGETTRYKVASSRRFGDPADMWSAQLDFAPRGQ